jgi:anti-sigma-K factor RskA
MTREEKLEAAGLYVLGVMEDGERATFERDMGADPELAGMVDRLAAEVEALDDTATAEAVPERLWSAIDARLGAKDDPDAGENGRVLPFAPPARRSPLAGLAMAASVMVAAGIGFVAGSATGPEAPAPTVIAVLINEADSMPGAIVEAFADDSVRIVPLEQFEVPEGRILEVWTLPDPETEPVSLGTFPTAGDVRLEGPDLPPPQDGQLYEITLEPAPGSPTGRPTGPILVKGFAKPPIL